jgi:predicted nucleic acid-binding protein
MSILLAATNANVPRRLVLDAGPLIALLYEDDRDHETASEGFSQLVRVRATMVVPVPILFEVCKWLLQESGPSLARSALDWIQEGSQLVYFEESDMDELTALISDFRTWLGSLEDGLVALIGLRLDVPVWTFNYRDLAAFQNLRFWVPSR